MDSDYSPLGYIEPEANNSMKKRNIDTLVMKSKKPILLMNIDPVAIKNKKPIW